MALEDRLTTDPKFDPECAYCAREFNTHVYFEDEICVLRDCDVCGEPLVIWKQHGIIPPPRELDHMFDVTWRHTGGFNQDAQFDATRSRGHRDHWHAHLRRQGRLSHV